MKWKRIEATATAVACITAPLGLVAMLALWTVPLVHDQALGYTALVLSGATLLSMVVSAVAARRAR